MKTEPLKPVSYTGLPDKRYKKRKPKDVTPKPYTEGSTFEKLFIEEIGDYDEYNETTARRSKS